MYFEVYDLHIQNMKEFTLVCTVDEKGGGGGEEEGRRRGGGGEEGEDWGGNLTENSHSSLGFRALLPLPSCSPITFSSTNKAINTVILARMVKAYLQDGPEVGDRRGV